MARPALPAHRVADATAYADATAHADATAYADATTHADTTAHADATAQGGAGTLYAGTPGGSNMLGAMIRQTGLSG